MLRLLALASAAGLLSPWLTALAAPHSQHLAWLFDLLSHWQWLYLGLLPLCLALLARRSPRWLLLLPLLALPWLSLATALPPQTGAARLSLQLVSANLQQSDDAGALRAWLDAQPADLVLLQEVSPAMAAQLQRWADYPHRLLAPEDSPFGLALLSRLPLVQPRVQVDGDGIPAIEAQVDSGAHDLALTLAHPMPPLSPYWQHKRDLGLQVLLQRNAATGLPGLLVGDLNASPWSHGLRQVEDLGWYRASDLRATWPTWGQGWLGIAIDQVLARGPWRVAEQSLGPDLGSDHLPRRLRLELLDND
ncbi:endonuclease/exonuclease/phosphatase family protein [Pseudomonas sp. CAU 1711]|uniref:endonuclease/exonuclease/phosphatase family protein n=1 Tax=Pseudomonas sp. CAU 1711 TaxID=3140356 RepID=UPI00325FEEA5